MLKAKVNDKVFEIENGSINGKQWDWDIIEIKDRMFHIIKDSRSYHATLVSHNTEEKTFTIRVNENDYTVQD